MPGLETTQRQVLAALEKITEYAPVGAHASDDVITSVAVLEKPAGATQIMVQALVQNIRYTLDGSTPTATHGFQLQAGTPPIVIAVPGVSIKIVQESAGAVLQRQWFS